MDIKTVLETIHKKCKAVAQGSKVLPLLACMSIFSASFPASGFDVTLTAMPNFEVISRHFVLDVGNSSLVVPMKSLIFHDQNALHA